jgi:hypothetical protein
MTILDVAHHLEVGRDLVEDVLERDVSRRYAEPKHLRAIAIDEFAAKGMRYMPIDLRVCPGRVGFGLVGWLNPTDVRPSRWVSPTLQRSNNPGTRALWTRAAGSRWVSPTLQRSNAASGTDSRLAWLMWGNWWAPVNDTGILPVKLRLDTGWKPVPPPDSPHEPLA